MTRFLLALETCVAVPTFIVAWLLSTFVFAARAGWKCAQLPAEQKREALVATFGKEKPGK